MAVKTEQFPVAAILRIILMVMIFVMDRELPQPLTAEFAPTARTDPRMDLEGFRPIALLPLLPAAPSSRPQFGPFSQHQHLIVSFSMTY